MKSAESYRIEHEEQAAKDKRCEDQKVYYASEYDRRDTAGYRIWMTPRQKGGYMDPENVGSEGVELIFYRAKRCWLFKNMTEFELLKKRLSAKGLKAVKHDRGWTVYKK